MYMDIKDTVLKPCLLHFVIHTIAEELFLNPDEVEKLHDFEEECVEDYTRVTRKAELHKAEGQVEILNKKIDHLQFRMDEIHVRQRHLRGLVHLVEEHLVYMEDNLHTTGVISPSPGVIHHQYNTNDMEHLTMTTSTTTTTVNSHEIPSNSIVNNSSEKDMIFTSSLLWLLKRQIAQDSGTTSNENIDYPQQLARSLVSQLGRRSRVPTGSFSSRQHQNHLDSTFERSPTCSVRMKHRNGRTDHRHSLPSFDYHSFPHSEGHCHGSYYDRMHERGRNRLPTNRIQHGSYRAPDLTYREYTTICDDIDLSCLSYPNSPIMSPNGSRMDLTSVGPIRNTNLPTDTTLIKTKEYLPIPKYQNIPFVPIENITNSTVNQIISSCMATDSNTVNNTTAKAFIEPKSAPATPKEERALLFQSPIMENGTKRSQSLATLHTNTKSIDHHSLIPTKHYTSYDTNLHFINPELYPYTHILTNTNTNHNVKTTKNSIDIQNLIIDLKNYTQDVSIAKENYIMDDHQDNNEYVDGDDNVNNADDDHDRRNVDDQDNEPDEDENMEEMEDEIDDDDSDDDGGDDDDNDLENKERKIQLGLQEAENAERIELQGAMLRRLRKLSTSVPSKPCHLSGVNNSTASHLDKHNNVKIITHGFNQINSQKTSCWNTENLPDSTEKSPIIGHTHEVGLISSEDMGDFLSHVANEEEAVDPDLDLDFDSIPHESSSLSSSGIRSYVESPVEQADTSLNLNDDIELISRNLRSSSGKMNTVIDDNDDDDASLSPPLNSLTTDNTINNNNNIQLSYPSPILEEKEEEEAEVEEVYADNNDLDDNHHCEVEVPRMTKSL
ncbi:unnamed protein product [Schistosoma margrebowiei]|uniref:Uncharacterized protein n=1 Tax=Schistosoma margrebowiei TaxID=48269 RepID=A0A183LV21_9TREM|nr:unnamed protein product [Schistosoma margrebowiei]